MTIDKAKLQPLLWAVVGAWKAGDHDMHLRTDALDAFLGETTVEEVALGLLAEIDRLVPFEEAYATACNVRNRLIKENDQLDRLVVANKVISDSFKAERDQLKAAISKPEDVFTNMKAGAIPRPSLRSMVDLYGEVVNGEDAQLLEIARLRAEVERLRDVAQEEIDSAGERAKEVCGARMTLHALTGERDQLKAENEALRKRLKGLVHVSDATGWEEHTCGEIAKARTLLGMEVRHG